MHTGGVVGGVVSFNCLRSVNCVHAQPCLLSSVSSGGSDLSVSCNYFFPFSSGDCTVGQIKENLWSLLRQVIFMSHDYHTTCHVTVV